MGHYMSLSLARWFWLGESFSLPFENHGPNDPQVPGTDCNDRREESKE